jgi:hypothetical protein
MYEIAVEVEKNLIRTALEGFMSESDFADFMRDEHAAQKQLRCAPGRHVLLCDLAKLNVVSQDMVAQVAWELNSEGPRDAAWIAIVISSALLKLQFQRILTRTNAMIFDNATSAEEWLMAESGYR